MNAIRQVILVDPVAGAGCTMSDLHPLRAVGYLILSVEALVVAWWWPRLYPPRRRKRGGGPQRRRRHRRQCSGVGGGANLSAKRSSRRSDSSMLSSHKSGDNSERWDGEGGGEGWSDAGRSSVPSSLLSLAERRSREAYPARIETCPSEGVCGDGTEDLSLGERQLEACSKQRLAVDEGVPVPLLRKARARCARSSILVLLTLSVSYLSTCLVLSGARARIYTTPDQDDWSNTPVIKGGNMGQQSPGMTGSRKEERDHTKALEMRRKKLAEVERRRREAEEEYARMKEREDKARQEAAAAAVAKAARQKQREAAKLQELERQALAAAEKKSLEESRALVEKQQREQKARDEQHAQDEERTKGEHDSRQRVEQQAREEQTARDEAAAKMRSAQTISTLEQNHAIGLERALTNGSTVLRVMPNGDLVLADGGKPVWIARGSKKRRSLVGWIWRKIRRKPVLRPCTACQLTVAPSGRVELRENGKLLWSNGQQGKKAEKKRRQRAQEAANVPGNGGSEAADRRMGFRLLVTDDGNAVLERGGSQVVWKALDR